MESIKAVGQFQLLTLVGMLRFGRSMTKWRRWCDLRGIHASSEAKVADRRTNFLNAIEVVNNLKEKNVKIGSCSGYPREVMDGQSQLQQITRLSSWQRSSNGWLTTKGGRLLHSWRQNVIDLGADKRRCVCEVDDAAPGIDEGHNAGMWTVGLVLSGNEAGLTYQEYVDADEATHTAAQRKAGLMTKQIKPALPDRYYCRLT